LVRDFVIFFEQAAKFRSVIWFNLANVLKFKLNAPPNL